jgi:hypothetical protein
VNANCYAHSSMHTAISRVSSAFPLFLVEMALVYRPIPAQSRHSILVSRDANIPAVYSVGDCEEARDLGKCRLICQ